MISVSNEIRYRSINSMGTTGVHNMVGRVYNLELSPVISAAPPRPVDACAYRGAPRKLHHAGTTTPCPQSTALITRTILKNTFSISITSDAQNASGVNDKERST
jgi:hypothetical protein